MRAVTFKVSVPGFLLAKSLGRWSEAAVYGRLSGVRVEDRDAIALPGPDWVRAEVLLSGICGSDIGNLTYSASPAMEPFGSFPAVLGHEIVARVVEVGSEHLEHLVGQRVTVDPFIHCRVRGWAEEAWCPSCASGRHATCELAGEEGPLEIDGRPFAPGLTQGYHRSVPGGWGAEIVAHASQVFPVADELDDRRAVLIEPLAVGLHAVLNAPRPSNDDPVLVLGSGPIALGTIWALRASGFDGEILAQTKRAREAELARIFGASTIITPGDEARQAIIDTGARAYMPIVGDEVYSGGGFPLVFDCVGSAQTLAQSLGWARPRGHVVMLGCAAQLSRLDLTFVWAREVTVQGFVGYGLEHWRGQTRHTFEFTHDLLLEMGTPVDEMVTHVFAIDQARAALSAAANRRRSGAVKVVFDPRL